MNYPNLSELRTLRSQEKAIKARIETVKPLAIEEAKTIQPDGGEFTVPGVGTFVLDRVPVFTLTNFSKYKDELAKLWRTCFKKRERYRAAASSQTLLMGGYMKSFVQATDKAPESYDYALKVKEG